jgi:hypothetical protein
VYPGVSVSEREIDRGIRTYPNPVKDEIKLATETKIIKLKIYNESGTLIREINGPDISIIDFKREREGIYYLSIYTDHGISVRKIVKIN